MMCEECGQKEATASLTVLINGEEVTRALCSDCMGRMQAMSSGGGIRNVLTALLGVLGGSVRNPGVGFTDEEMNRVCSCGLSGRGLYSGRRAGCPDCYKTFAPMLKRLTGNVRSGSLLPFEKSAVEEAVKEVPAQEEFTAEEAHESNEVALGMMIHKLQDQMNEAVAREDYETAASIRDQLRTLSKGREE